MTLADLNARYGIADQLKFIEGPGGLTFAEIDNAPDPAQRRAEIEARLEAIGSPFRTAHAFELEDIIVMNSLCRICRRLKAVLTTAIRSSLLRRAALSFSTPSRMRALSLVSLLAAWAAFATRIP